MVNADRAGKSGPSGTRKGDDARAERLKAALRENLKRRKAQIRGRDARGEPGAAASAHDSAEIVPDKSVE